MKRFVVFLVVALLVVPGRVAASPAAERCFDATGFCISGPIGTYWERHGGLQVFGYPISGAHLETVEGRTLQTQWFERDRLEIQDNGTITAGRLGARWLEVQGQPWQNAATVSAADPGCVFFPVTGHQLCAPFVGYWQANGGLERFGYPITEQISEAIEGQTYLVQYFERRRMEYHPDMEPRYQVLLGRLGAELQSHDSCLPLGERDEPVAYRYRVDLGCPIVAGRELVGTSRVVLRDVPVATQRFEGGTMLWLQEFAGDARSPGRIYVIFHDTGSQSTWQRFDDQWHEGQPTGVTGTPPPGKYAPQRGFGLLWASNAEVRGRLGWALAPEQGETGGYRRFSKGFMLYRPSQDRYYLITDDGVARNVTR